LDQITTKLRQDFDLESKSNVSEAVSQIDTSVNDQMVDSDILAQFFATSKRLTNELNGHQLELIQNLVSLKAEMKSQAEIMAKTQNAKRKVALEIIIGELDEEIVSLERVIASLKDILPGIHAEFETRCNEKIAQVANAVKDPSSWDVLMSPAAEQANAQPLVSKWDPISSSGGAKPCECKTQMVEARTTEMDAHLPRPDAHDQPLPQPSLSPI